jgi:hypothetical protein
MFSVSIFWTCELNLHFSVSLVPKCKTGIIGLLYFYQSKDVEMAEDAVRMEEIDNAYFNLNYLNYFQKLGIRKSGCMKKFHEKDIIMYVLVVEISEV